MKGVDKKLRCFALFLIVVFCVRYIPIDTRAGVSYFKFVVALFCPFVFIAFSPKISKAFLLIVVYALFVLFASMMHPQTLRWSTIVYNLSYWLMFLTFYNLIYERQVFDADFFIRFLKGFIIAYFVLLLIQQVAIVAGVKYLPVINLTQFLDRGIGANSFSGEPSASARVLVVLFLALVRMFELKYERGLFFRDIYREAKWPTIGFLWCMLTMGSGTAFVALGILSLYFVRRQYAFVMIPLLIIFYSIIPYVDFVPLQRAYNAFNAFLTLDVDVIMRTDGSAAARLMPLVNTITSLDLTDWETWFGHGVDHALSDGLFSSKVMIGGIGDYGLLSFIVMQILVYTCAIRHFFSLETLFWVFIFNMTLGNVPFQWGCLMIFTAVRYFQEQNERGVLIMDKDENKGVNEKFYLSR